MLDRIVFGRVGRIMRDANLEPQFICQSLEVLLEQKVPRIVTAAALTQQQESPTVRIEAAPMLVPPAPQAFDRQFAGIVTGAELNVADVETHIV